LTTGVVTVTVPLVESTSKGGTVYERSYGYRYNEVDGGTVDIAKVIRRDVKQAVAEGLLPARWSYSVRSPHGTSIDVEVRDCPDAWRDCDGGQGCRNVWCTARNDPAYAHAAEKHVVLTEEAEAARMTLERIHNAYNHDGSELQTDYFDVRYYGYVSFEDASSADFRKREAERLAAKKAAREHGEVVGRVANYGRDGRAIVHVLVRTPEDKQVFACGARVSRSGLRQRVSDDAEVTCSRCARRLEKVS
jgi:hypothetical protein